jgi:hypothetical protein
MRTRKVGRWVVRLVAIAAFGVVAIFGVTAATADETDRSHDTPVDTPIQPDSNEWD